MNDDLGRAVEAVLLVAVEPVPPGLLAARETGPLAADAETADDRPVALDVVPAHIIQKAAASTDQLHQSPAGVMVA